MVNKVAGTFPATFWGMDGMRTIKLIIQYDGTDFSGWQVQPRKRTVQETLEQVLAKILNEKIHVVAASRTDAGVHALGQVAHFHTHNSISCRRLLAALNGLLPADMAVLRVQQTSSSFHAIKNARRKTYRYLLWNSPVRAPLLANRVWHVWESLNVKAMKSGARHLFGVHDFSAFRGANSDTKTSVRKIEKISIRFSEKILKIEITGNGFLKYMVRNIVGTLVEVGKGKRTPEDIKKILASKDRRKAGAPAPACGLYLVKIDYGLAGGGLAAGVDGSL